MITILDGDRIEHLWYIEQRLQAGIRRLWVRAETEAEAIEYTIDWGVPRDQIHYISSWGLSLDSPGVILASLTIQED